MICRSLRWLAMWLVWDSPKWLCPLVGPFAPWLFGFALGSQPVPKAKEPWKPK